MQLSDPDAYYAERDVPHTAQGDIHAGIPFVHATLLTSAFEPAGARKRPDAREPDERASWKACAQDTRVGSSAISLL